MHKAGFVAIVGKPNAGKSTLMNAMLKERLSIITPKAQTTRHKILGILNEPDYQIVFCDTPGIVKPKYGLHEAMMMAVNSSLTDAEVVLLMVDIAQTVESDELVEKLKNSSSKVLLLINKVDTTTQDLALKQIDAWKTLMPNTPILPVSALKDFNLDGVLSFILESIPEHPAYYEKDEITDRHLRFVVAEMIRERIFTNCEQEIPYSAEVVVTNYVEGDTMDRISAEIIVERDSQKAIIIGKGGSMLKKIGMEARITAEKFLDKKVFLEVFVKVVADWRNKENYLKKFGYETK